MSKLNDGGYDKTVAKRFNEPVAAQAQPSGNAVDFLPIAPSLPLNDPAAAYRVLHVYGRQCYKAALAAQASGQNREDAELLNWLEDQAKASRTGVSIDYVYDSQNGYVNERGYRFMRFRFIGPIRKTVREAIDAARTTAKTLGDNK